MEEYPLVNIQYETFNQQFFLRFPFVTFDGGRGKYREVRFVGGRYQISDIVG